MSALYREMMDRRLRYGSGYKIIHYRSGEVAYSNTKRHISDEFQTIKKEMFDASGAPARPDSTARL
ncbi:hypothetical protein JQK15_24860 [Sphingobium sp. BHU LFT2]|uniref:hypothetical protein n=1 Tax=Sphingobium sp. BHU LFT2 TaxID=2807634 RepID=UPI001BEA9E8A|nr:hypothetical protein [Sphingobium sp. BHU LFT2]MBT2246742.1 hypothetical protein [Sphingobium sp. BHU LFT2]